MTIIGICCCQIRHFENYSHLYRTLTIENILRVTPTQDFRLFLANKTGLTSLPLVQLLQLCDTIVVEVSCFRVFPEGFHSTFISELLRILHCFHNIQKQHFYPFENILHGTVYSFYFIVQMYYHQILRIESICPAFIALILSTC